MMYGESIKSDHNLISVIVPVYNAANDLRRCLDSLLRQTYTGYEVLLINDGSTDGSGLICDAYAEAHQQFNVYHLKNGGVSAARNTGMEKARGNYIAFVDADDYVEDTYLDLLLPPRGEDFSVCGVKILAPNGAVSVEHVPGADGDNAQQTVINHHLVRTVWGKLFKRSVVASAGIKFNVSLRVGEDTCFVLEFLSAATSVFIRKDLGYVYIKPGYRIDKYRTGPGDLVALYTVLCACELKLAQRGFDVEGLEKYNRNVIGFNLLTALYLVKKYSVKTRDQYITAFKKAGKQAAGDMGLPGFVAGGMRFIERSGSRVLTDRFLFLSMKMIWLKAKFLNN
ncbi:glycosyltransferase [Niabella pedocola]|uniref:Glycosyltransferase n=1 Tax=Niabella pedocola TaxID=1752077 RepID=A0ABS8PWJ6_9BACT|nr:glycosyltransferase family 2 protein [Niabella pedocola]MCD2425444.1 glycosyltransferase [Niabella pedocola]